MSRKALIIGAGPAGLTAAYELLKKSKDIEVTVFEETEQFGGISKTVEYKGNRMDMGGHRFFSKIPEVNAWWDEKQQRILLTFDCDHPAIVIGKEGKTLEAIQYLSTLALSRHFDKPISVITDTQNYWRKAEDKIDAEIEKGISLIKNGHSVFRFRPMSAQLRRYIHRAVEGNEFVATASEGEGKWRKVTFRPTEKATAALQANQAPADFVPGVIGEDIPAQSTPETPVVVEEQVTLTEQVHPPVETVSVTQTVTTVESAPAPEAAPAAQEPVGPLFDTVQTQEPTNK